MIALTGNRPFVDLGAQRHPVADHGVAQRDRRHRSQRRRRLAANAPDDLVHRTDFKLGYVARKIHVHHARVRARINQEPGLGRTDQAVHQDVVALQAVLKRLIGAQLKQLLDRQGTPFRVFRQIVAELAPLFDHLAVFLAEFVQGQLGRGVAEHPESGLGLGLVDQGRLEVPGAIRTGPAAEIRLRLTGGRATARTRARHHIVRPQENPAFPITDHGVQLAQEIRAENDIKPPGPTTDRKKISREQLPVLNHRVAQLQAGNPRHRRLLLARHPENLLVVRPDFQPGLLGRPVMHDRRMRPGIDHESHRLAADLAVDVNMVALDVELERLVPAKLQHLLDSQRSELGIVQELIFELGPLAHELLVRLAQHPDRLIQVPAVLQLERDRGAGLSGDHCVKRFAVIQREPPEGGRLLGPGGNSQAGRGGRSKQKGREK